MKAKCGRLLKCYRAALGRHLKRGARATFAPATGLGRQALTLGLETLDLARIHEHALAALLPAEGVSGTRDGVFKRAGTFFVEALRPIEQTRHAAMETSAHLNELNQALSRHAAELATTNRRLKREIARRQAVEEALKRSEEHHQRLLAQSRLMQEQLRRLSHQLLRAQEDERKQISRELHDNIAQTLTAIHVHLATLKTEASANTKQLQRRITRTQRFVEKSVKIVHQFARKLRPTVLDDLGLIPALSSFMKDFTKRTGLRIRFTAFADVEKMSNAKRTVFYRVAQSALTNVALHAQAKAVRVTIQKLGDAVLLEIQDDGKGFEVEQVLFARGRQRLGLLGMRERVEMVGGSFGVESSPGRGTTIRAQVAFANGSKVKAR